MKNQTLRQRKIGNLTHTRASGGHISLRSKRRRRGNENNLRSSLPTVAITFLVWLFLIYNWPGETSYSEKNEPDKLLHKKLRGFVNAKNTSMKKVSQNMPVLKDTVPDEIHEAEKKNTFHKQEIIVCSSGRIGILNDDYCDCEEGEDEPKTNACSHLLVQKKIFDCGDGTYVFSSRVFDGFFDCKNGHDEN